MKRQELLAGVGGGTVASAIGHGAAEISVRELERREKAARGPSRAQRKVVKRRAVEELQDVSQGQLVLCHIHPRWLRAEIEARLDRGEAIMSQDVEVLRALGPNLARIQHLRERSI